MKKVLFVICLLVSYKSYCQTSGLSLKAVASYAHDFPGLNGKVLGLELNQFMTERLQGGIAVKRYDLNGNPRTPTVEEYTKATTIDLNAYYVLINTSEHIVRIGAGYSFSFYKTRRSYPLFHGGLGSTPQWIVNDKKSRTTGFILSGEYEYLIPSLNIGIGVKAAMGKAFDQVTSAGPLINLYF